MNVFYDNLVYGLQKIGGISSYWYELTSRFLKNKEVGLKFLETGMERDNILRQLLNLNQDDLTIRRRGGLLIERFMRINLPSFEEGIFHSSYFRVPSKSARVKRVCTVHDFTHDLYFNGPRVWLHNLAKKRAILESDAIIAVSENTKKDLLSFFPGISESKIHVIYNGVSDQFQILDLKVAEQPPTLLYVGARDNYKNFKFAVEITESLNDYHLNIVGSSLNTYERRFLDAHIQGRYTVFTNISIEKLNILYNRSVCLLYPSSYEGFGIPLLEAMRAGCPFLAVNTSSIPEVAGNAGILISGLDIEEARDAVSLLRASRASYVDIGFQQSLKFSWDRCYKETYKVYCDLV